MTCQGSRTTRKRVRWSIRLAARLALAVSIIGILSFVPNSRSNVSLSPDVTGSGNGGLGHYTGSPSSHTISFQSTQDKKFSEQGYQITTDTRQHPERQFCGDEPFHTLPNPPLSLEQTFVGPGLDNQSVTNQSKVAVCNIDWHRSGFSPHFDIHFPHTMETVFLCWSWWWQHPQKQKVLEVPPDFDAHIQHSKFNAAFMEWMKEEVILTHHATEEIKAVRVIPRREAHWFYQPPDAAQSLRDRLVHHHFPERKISGCPVTDTTNDILSTVRIGILNRKKSRDIRNMVELTKALQALVTTKVIVTYFESASFKDQVDFFSSIDILISPHGAQLTGVIFMPRCGALLELFPKSYWIPEFFGHLALGAGLQYNYLYLAPSDKVNDMALAKTQNFRFRARARAAHFHVPIARVVAEVNCMISQWASCCANHS